MQVPESNIIQSIKDGMISAISDATIFTEDFSSAINTEYLVTVNIAQSLSRHCALVGEGNLRIDLEKKTKDFSTSALPFLLPGDKSYRRNIFRRGTNVTRNGRVDIAILKSGTELERRSWGAIEVKGFKPRTHTVNLDLRRNAEFILLEGPTGSSSVELTVLCAFETCKNIYLESDKDAANKKISSRYQNIVNNLNIDSRISAEIVVFEASSELATGNESPEDFFYLDNIHYHAGVLVIFRRV